MDFGGSLIAWAQDSRRASLCAAPSGPAAPLRGTAVHFRLSWI